MDTSGMLASKKDRLTWSMNLLSIVVSITAIVSFWETWQRRDDNEKRERMYEVRDSMNTAANHNTLELYIENTKRLAEQVLLSRLSLDEQRTADSTNRVNYSLNRQAYLTERLENLQNRNKQDAKDKIIIESYKTIAEQAVKDREYRYENDRPGFEFTAVTDFSDTLIDRLRVRLKNLGRRQAIRMVMSILIIDVDSIDNDNYSGYYIDTAELPQKALYPNGKARIRYDFPSGYFINNKYILCLVDYLDWELDSKPLYFSTFFVTSNDGSDVDFCHKEQRQKIMDFVLIHNITKFNYKDLQKYL